MIFRALAAGTLALGTLTLVAGLALLGKGPAATPDLAALRRGKDRVTAPAAYAAWTSERFVALPHGKPRRVVDPLEARGVSLDGYVQRTMLAGDGDLHLEVVGTPRLAGGPDTAYVTAEITPRWRRKEGWTVPRLLATFRPNRGDVTPWAGGPRRVRVSGWLLYDYQYDRVPSGWALEHAAPRLTGWEIHPVTRIEVWNDARGGWEDLPS